MWEDARLIKSSPFIKSLAWAEDTENMGKVNIPKKNAKPYRVFKSGSSKYEKKKQIIHAKMERKIKTTLLSNLSDTKPTGIWAITPPSTERNKNNPNWGLDNPISFPKTGPSILKTGELIPATIIPHAAKGESFIAQTGLKEGNPSKVGGLLVVKVKGKRQRQNNKTIIL